LKRKLQVFVSSTYEDLKDERQYAVQAILSAGHIPAGMELFSAGDESQKETIKKWIEESDVYLLILGGRYGSTGKSYTHWEYEYAGILGKPRFAVVISDDALELKVKKVGTTAMEKANLPLYQEFRSEVLNKICKIYDDYRDIQIAIFHKMNEYSDRKDLIGWIHGNEVPDTLGIINENSRLILEITDLKKNLEEQTVYLNEALKPNTLVRNFDGLTFEELREILSNIIVILPDIKVYEKEVDRKVSIFRLFTWYTDSFVTGISNEYGAGENTKFLFYSVAPKLMTFGLLEKLEIEGVKYEKIQMTKMGFEFTRAFALDIAKISTVGKNH
jgi:hypothetical protein